MADDQALLAAARAGDQRAFAALYRDHHRRAMHEARKVVPNSSDAEDCVAAAFASTFQAIRKGGGPTEAFRPYLMTAVRNSALQLVRLKRYGSEVATEVLEPPAHVDLYEIGADPAVRNAFANLPERWREVLWKTEIEGVAPRDLAAELAMSANGVAALAKRARDGFRKAYLAEAVGPDPHPWAMERLHLHRDGALDPRTRDLVELHMENCARCQDTLAPAPITAASIGVLLLAAGVPASAAIKASAGGLAGASLIGRVRRLRTRSTAAPAKLATATAAAVAIVGTALVVVISARQDDRAPNSTTPPTVVATTTSPAVVGASVTARPPSPPTSASVVATVAPSTVPTASPATSALPSTTVAPTDGPTTVRRRSTTSRRRSVSLVPVPSPLSATPDAAAPDPAAPDPAAPDPAAPDPTTPDPAVSTSLDVITTTVAPAAAAIPPPAITAPAPTTASTTTTTVDPPEYGGALVLDSRGWPSYTVTVRATEPDGLPAGTTIALLFSSAEPWAATIAATSNCAGLPLAMSGGADEVGSASCASPALPQGATAVVSFTTAGTAVVTVMVTAQRPGGQPVTQCDPSPCSG